MKDQVTTIEHSKRLIEMGVPAEKASMAWVKDPNEGVYSLAVHDEFCYEMSCLEPRPAFSVADLMELLPMFIEQDDTYYLNISKCYEGWYVGYETEKGSELFHYRGVELVDVFIETIDRLFTNGYKLNV